MFKRYSDPLTLINGIIKTHRFGEFVSELIRIRNDEIEEEYSWQYYLHKVFADISFKDFKATMEQQDAHKQISEEEIISTVSESQNIIANFVPPDSRKK